MLDAGIDTLVDVAGDFGGDARRRIVGAVYTAMAALAPPPPDLITTAYRLTMMRWMEAAQHGNLRAVHYHAALMALEDAYPLDCLRFIAGQGIPPGDHLRNALDRYMAENAAPSAPPAPVVSSEPLVETDSPPAEGGHHE